jgi:hypothetical protein
MSTFSRRNLLKGMMGTAGLAAGARLGGRHLIGEARAGNPAGKSAVVVVWMPGGYSSIFGSPDTLVGKQWAALKATDIVDIGSGASQFSVHKLIGNLPNAKTNMASVGIANIPADHGAGSTYFMGGSNDNYAIRLAAEMGGDAAIKAACVGPYIPQGSPRDARGGVSLELVNDLSSVIQALGASSGTPNLKAPARDVAARALARSQAMSAAEIKANPKSLAGYEGGYSTIVEAYKKPIPKLPTFDEIAAPYRALLTGDWTVGTKIENDGPALYSKFIGAELMLRSGTNFVLVNDALDDKTWSYDLHEQDGTEDIQWLMGTNYLSTYRDVSMIKGFSVFLDRIFNSPGLADMNITVAFMGEFSRTVPDSGHNSNVTASVFGSRVKPGTTGRCDSQNDLPANTPSMEAFWGYLAALSGVKTNPFGTSYQFHQNLIV